MSEDFNKLKGVTPTIAEKLSENYESIVMLSMTPPSELAKVVGLSQRVAQMIVRAARTSIGSSPVTAFELLEEVKKTKRITTGSMNLDGILGGGIQTGVITEFSGAYSTGKTQLMFQLCINVQLDKDEGGLGGCAYFIDTEMTFAPNRVIEIATNTLGAKDARESLSKIYVSKAFNTEHQVSLIQESEKLIKQNNIKLLIIDSIASHVRSEYAGKEAIASRQQSLMAQAENLQRIATSYELAVVCTNQVLVNFADSFSGSAVEPALGYAWAHRPTHRIFLRKSKGQARIARVFDSPELPEQEAVFYITGGGIRDKAMMNGSR